MGEVSRAASVVPWDSPKEANINSIASLLYIENIWLFSVIDMFWSEWKKTNTNWSHTPKSIRKQCSLYDTTHRFVRLDYTRYICWHQIAKDTPVFNASQRRHDCFFHSSICSIFDLTNNFSRNITSLFGNKYTCYIERISSKVCSFSGQLTCGTSNKYSCRPRDVNHYKKYSRATVSIRITSIVIWCIQMNDSFSSSYMLNRYITKKNQSTGSKSVELCLADGCDQQAWPLSMP